MDPEKVVIIKTARGEDEMETLNREFQFYEGELKHLQGHVVPLCFGSFRGKVDGVDFGCLVLEYCSGHPAAVYGLPDDYK